MICECTNCTMIWNALQMCCDVGCGPGSATGSGPGKQSIQVAIHYTLLICMLVLMFC